MLLIDGRALQTRSTVRGIGSYLRGLLGGLHGLRAAPDIELLLTAGQPEPAEIASLSLRARRSRIPSLHPTLQPMLDPLLVARAVSAAKPALYHAVEWGQPLWSHAPVVVTLHDLIPFIFPRHYPWVRRSHWAALHLLRRADCVVAVSRSTAHDVERIAGVDPSRITVIGEGIAQHFSPATPDAVQGALDRFHITRPYVLAVGTFDPRKRIRNLARVMRHLSADHDVQLVIAGEQGNFAGTVSAALQREGVAARSRLLGHVEVSDLATLYTGSLCLLFTSAYEGFGLPPLEAMRAGTVAVMYRNSSLVEVAGPAAVLVPDGDAGAMAAAASRLLVHPSERTTRVTAGRAWAESFTWERTAAATLEVYQRLIREGRRAAIN